MDFVKKAFRGLVEISFWIILIGCAVAGGVIAAGISRYDNYTFWGVLIGVAIGVLVDIVVGGVTATLIAIEENTAKTEENTAEMLRVLLKTANITANGGGSGNSRVADEQGRINYRTWWDSDDGKHESWEDADGTRHET